jgi:hypothetical protein
MKARQHGHSVIDEQSSCSVVLLQARLGTSRGARRTATSKQSSTRASCFEDIDGEEDRKLGGTAASLTLETGLACSLASPQFLVRTKFTNRAAMFVMSNWVALYRFPARFPGVASYWKVHHCFSGPERSTLPVLPQLSSSVSPTPLL